MRSSAGSLGQLRPAVQGPCSQHQQAGTLTYRDCRCATVGGAGGHRQLADCLAPGWIPPVWAAASGEWLLAPVLLAPFVSPGTQLTHAPHCPGRQPCRTSCAAAMRTTAASAAYRGGCAPPSASCTAPRRGNPSCVARLLHATAHTFLCSIRAVYYILSHCILHPVTPPEPHSHRSAGRGRAGQGRAAVRGAVRAQRLRRRLAARGLQGAPRPAGLPARPRAATAAASAAHAAPCAEACTLRRSSGRARPRRRCGSRTCCRAWRGRPAAAAARARTRSCRVRCLRPGAEKRALHALEKPRACVPCGRHLLQGGGRACRALLAPGSSGAIGRVAFFRLGAPFSRCAHLPRQVPHAMRRRAVLARGAASS